MPCIDGMHLATKNLVTQHWWWYWGYFVLYPIIPGKLMAQLIALTSQLNLSDMCDEQMLITNCFLLMAILI